MKALPVLVWIATQAAFGAGPVGASTKPPVAMAKRAPFTIELRMGKDSLFRQEMEGGPYVHENVAFVFPKDAFGLKLTLQADSTYAIAYQSDTSKSDAVLAFEQDTTPGGKYGMLLRTTNKTHRTLYFSAGMNLPGRNRMERTSVVPVRAKLSSYELWPHPIRQLALFEWTAKAPQAAP